MVYYLDFLPLDEIKFSDVSKRKNEGKKKPTLLRKRFEKKKKNLKRKIIRVFEFIFAKAKNYQ